MNTRPEKNDIPEEVRRFISDPDGYFDAEEYFTIAEYYETNIDLDNTFKALKHGVAAYPADIPLRIEFARMHIVSGAYHKASKLLKSLLKDSALKEQDDILAVHVMFTRVHAELREYEKVRADINAIKQWVDGLEYNAAITAITDIASNQCLGFMYDYAIKTLKKGLKLFPKDTSLYANLIECQVKNNSDFGEAIKTCEEALDADPYSVELWNKLGYLYKFTNNLKESIRAFDYATSIDDKNREAWRAMGDCHMSNGNAERAAECYIKAMDDDCTDTSLINHIGDALNNCDKYAEARKYYKEVLDIEEDNPDAMFGIGMSYFLDSANENSNYENAIFWIKRALLENENNSLYWDVLGECYFHTNNYEQCIYCCQRALATNGDPGSSLARMGHSYTLIGNHKEAVPRLLEAKRIDATLDITDVCLAISFYSLGDKASASSYLLQALQDDDEAGEMFLNVVPEAEDFVNNVKKLL